MKRLVLVVLTAGLLAGSAAGQSRPIQWISNANQGVAQARRTRLPLLFYVRGRSRGNESSIVRDQRRAFRDPMVSKIATSFFVPVRLANSPQTRTLLQNMGAPTASDQLVVATPEGDLIGTISAMQARSAGGLAKALMEQFRQYRAALYKKDVKPILDSKTSSSRDLIAALRLVDRFVIVEADEAVATLLERPGLPKTVRKQVYKTLATLSTPKSVAALLDVATSDKLAAKALARCTPAGAKAMLPALDPADAAKLVIVYEAVTKICRVPKKRPRGFWNHANEELQIQEIERVKDLVQKKAARWEKTYGKLR